MLHRLGDQRQETSVGRRGTIVSVKDWLHRYAILMAILTFLVVITGAWETTARNAGGASDGMAGSVHFGLGIAAAALVIGLAVGLITSGLRALGWIALVVVIVDAGLGKTTAAVSHACVAQVLFAITVVAATCTSRAWKGGPDVVMDQGWPSLRSLASLAAVFVMAQVILGAAFRHKTMGLTWHIVGAMVVALAILFVGMCVMQQCPKHRSLRPAAISLLTIGLAQVLLGITAVTAEMMAPDDTVPPVVMFSTAAHVAVGALTLAAALAIAVQVRRHVHKAAEEPEEEGESAASA
jgi:hypothetical protein